MPSKKQADTLFTLVKIGLANNFTFHHPARSSSIQEQCHRVLTSVLHFHYTTFSLPSLHGSPEFVSAASTHHTQWPHPPICLCTMRTGTRGTETSNFSFASWTTACLLQLFPNYVAQQDSESTVKCLEETPLFTLTSFRRDCISNYSSINISTRHFARSCHLCPLSCSYATICASLEQELLWLLMSWNREIF